MTTQFLHLSPELARRIEMAEARAAVEGAETFNRLRPGGEAAVERIAGGFAIYCGANSPITQAVGMGLEGPMNEEDFDRLEDFYEERHEPVRVEVCPLADRSMFEHFGKRGYRVAEFSNVMALPLGREEGAPNWPASPAEVDIEKLGLDQVDLWTATVAQGFAEHYPVIKEILEVMKMFAMSPSTECYLARVGGKVAGGATLAIRNGVAGLFGASTLPEFRNRGVQTAAFNLPNDERVREKKGSKKVFLKNIMEAKFSKSLVPIAQRVLGLARSEQVLVAHRDDRPP